MPFRRTGGRLRRRGVTNRLMTRWLGGQLEVRPQQQCNQRCVDCNKNGKHREGQDSPLPAHGPEHNDTAAIDSELPQSSDVGWVTLLAIRRGTSRGTCPSGRSEALSQVEPASSYRRCRCSAW